MKQKKGWKRVLKGKKKSGKEKTSSSDEVTPSGEECIDSAVQAVKGKSGLLNEGSCKEGVKSTDNSDFEVLSLMPQLEAREGVEIDYDVDNNGDSELQRNIRLADQCFMRNQFDEAVDLCLNAMKYVDENDVKDMQTLGDINVKISSIKQGHAELEEALAFLVKAKDIYSECIQKDKDAAKQALGVKLVETMTGMANIYVDQREIVKASEVYKDAIKASRELFDSEEKVADTLLNYGRFLSVCNNDHMSAIDILKEVLKIQLKASNGAVHPKSPLTLNCLGKVYMRKFKDSNSKDGKKDAKRAEACFLRALQLFRLSMVRSGNEKVVDTICCLNEARECQIEKKGILRNVRFEVPPLNTEQLNLDTSSSDSEESSSCCSSQDISRLSTYSDLSRDDRKLTFFDLGFTKFFSCADTEMKGIELLVDEDGDVKEHEVKE